MSLVNVDVSLIVIVSNTLVVFATFLATLYRIKIERDQVQSYKKNMADSKCLEAFRKYIRAERAELVDMDQDELSKFLDYLETLGKTKH